MSKITVIKFGGSLSKDETSINKFLDDAAKLSKNEDIVIVHGGGPEVNAWLTKAGIEPKFVNGLRFTDEKTLEIVEMILSGKVNKSHVAGLLKRKVKAVGLSGKDACMVVCDMVPGLGFVGEPSRINPKIIQDLLKAGYVPVVSSLGLDKKGQTLNINADSVAMALAVALKAEKLVLLTNVPGVLDADKKLISVIRRKDISGLVKNGVITGGMIPKIKACGNAVAKGVKQVVIADGAGGLIKLKGTIITK